MGGKELIQQIEEKREKAQEEVEELLEILQQEKETMEKTGIRIENISYRIKETESILEKIKFLKLTWSQDKQYLEILNEMKDIIGITVEIEDFEESSDAARKIICDEITRALSRTKRLKCSSIRSVDENLTGYVAEQIYYKGLNYGIPFEIQVSDTKNIAIRDNTHEEFKEEKYMMLRNPERYRKHVNELYHIFRADLKIAKMRATHNDKEEEATSYKEILDKLELITERRQLALIGEENKEKRIYREVLKLLGLIYGSYKRANYQKKDKMFEEAAKYIGNLLDEEYDVGVRIKEEEGMEIDK